RLRLIQHHSTKTFYRENEVAFPPPDAEEVSLYLTPAHQLSLSYPEGEKQPFSYRGRKENIHFTLDSPFDDSFEILGSPYLELEVRTEAEDLDLSSSTCVPLPRPARASRYSATTASPWTASPGAASASPTPT